MPLKSDGITPVPWFCGAMGCSCVPRSSCSFCAIMRVTDPGCTVAAIFACFVAFSCSLSAFSACISLNASSSPLRFASRFNG